VTYQSMKDASPAGVPWLAITAVIACISVFTITLGLTYPLLSLILEARGVGEGLIGLSAAMTPLGLVLSAPLVPMAARIARPFPFVVASIVLSAVFLMAIGIVTDYAAWLVLRFLLGIFVNGLFVVSEAWINQLATDRVRGRIIGFYTAVLILGYGIGPLIIPAAGIEGLTPFLVGAGFILASLVPVFAARGAVEALHDPAAEKASIRAFAPRAPVLLLSFAAIAMLDNASMSLMPLYGMDQGLSRDAASFLLFTLLAGGVALQYPIGWLADIVPRRSVTVGTAALTVLGCLLLPSAMGWGIGLWPMVFLWGGAAFGAYTMALAELGERFSGSMLIAGSAALAMTWGLTTVVGLPIAGGAMQAFGGPGFLVAIAALYVLLIVLAPLGDRRSGSVRRR